MSSRGVPDVVVVDHHDSYTWNLVHLVAAVTGVLPTVVQHDEVEPDDVLRHSHVVLSPGPGTPADPADFAVGREVLLAATRPVLGRLPRHAGPGDDVRRHGRARRARARRGGAGRATTARASSPGCRRTSRRCATTRSPRSTLPDVLRGDRAGRRTTAGDGRAAPRRCRWRACSSTPSRSCPSTARAMVANFLGVARRAGAATRRRPSARSPPRTRAASGSTAAAPASGRAAAR